jgi:tRNA pseudouridine55 synthase
MEAERGCVHSGGPKAMGLLVLDKPSAVTSRRVVDQVSRLVPGVKVGHAGTLDPLASGVLVVCLDAATRLVERIHMLPKSYSVQIRLGAKSDTLDADGRIEVEPSPIIPSRAEVEAVLAGMVGEIAQRPPEYSAKRVKGRRAYDLARAGQTVELAPRRVRIDQISVVDYSWPRLSLAIDCGSGTYIRSIARDVGESLGSCGLVEVLKRTGIGPFTIEQAVSPSTLAAEGVERHVRPAVLAVLDLPRLVVDAQEIAAVRQGRRLGRPDVPGVSPVAGEIALVDAEGALIALAEAVEDGRWVQPRTVFV